MFGAHVRVSLWFFGARVTLVFWCARARLARIDPTHFELVPAGWESDDALWNDAYLLQPGMPQGVCQAHTPGVFSRAWSAGTAVLDCNTWSAQLPFPSL